MMKTALVFLAAAAVTTEARRYFRYEEKVAPVYAPTGAPDQFWINFGATPDQMVIQWATTVSSPTSVSYGTAANSLNSIATGNTTSYSMGSYTSPTIHSVTLSGLSPGTEYFYQISGSNETFSFTSLRGVGEIYPFRIGFLGDPGDTQNSTTSVATLLAQHAVQPLDSVTIVGDLSYANGNEPIWDSWQVDMSPMTKTIPTHVLPGNHEMETNNLANLFEAYETRFNGMPYPEGSSGLNQWWSIKTGPVYNIYFNAFGIYSPGSDQYNFIVGELAKVNRTETPWLLVSAHVPLYCSNSAHQGSGTLVLSTFEDIFYQNNVALYVNGHVHAYERTLPTYKNAVNNKGPVYITAGASGSPEGLYKTWQSPPPAWSANAIGYEFGAATWTIINNTHSLWTYTLNNQTEDEYADYAYILNPYFL